MQQTLDDRQPASGYAATLKRFTWQGLLMLALVGSLVMVIVTSTVKAPPPAHAADSGATWTPGDVTWEILDDGRCITTQAVDVNTKSHEDAVAMSDALSKVPAKKDYPADSGILDTHANVGTSINTTNFSVILHSYLTGDKCQAPGNIVAPPADNGGTPDAPPTDNGTNPDAPPADNGTNPDAPPADNGTNPDAPPADATPDQVQDQQVLLDAAGHGELDAIQLAATPTWLKGAIAAIVGAAVYVGVSAMVTAGITATGVLVGATAATIAAVTAVSGCIGGAASTAVTLLLASSGSTWKSTLANAAAGCLTGAAIGLLPIKTVGESAGNAIRGALGFAPAAVVGEAGVTAAASAGVELSGITQVTTTAADALVAVQ